MVVVFICLLIQQINFSPSKDLLASISLQPNWWQGLRLLFMILLENLKLKNDSSCTIEDLHLPFFLWKISINWLYYQLSLLASLWIWYSALYWVFLVVQMVKNPPAVWETWVRSLDWEDPLEKGTVTTSVFWPGEFHEQRSLESYSPWGCRVGHDWATFTSL